MVSTPTSLMTQSQFAAFVQRNGQTACVVTPRRHVMFWACQHITEHRPSEIVGACPECGSPPHVATTIRVRIPSDG